MKINYLKTRMFTGIQWINRFLVNAVLEHYSIVL